MPPKASAVASSPDNTRPAKRQRTMSKRATEQIESKNETEDPEKSDSKALKAPQKGKSKSARPTSLRRSQRLVSKEANSSAMHATGTSAASSEAENAKKKPLAQRIKKGLSRKEAALKKDLLERVSVALIVNQITRVYCVPCGEGVEVAQYAKHEARDEHTAHTVEWKRKCLHFAEKESYKYLRTDDTYEDGELVKSNMIYESAPRAFRKCPRRLSSTFDSEPEMEAEVKGLEKKKALWESLEPQDQFVDYTDAARQDEFVKDFTIETSSVR